MLETNPICLGSCHILKCPKTSFLADDGSVDCTDLYLIPLLNRTRSSNVQPHGLGPKQEGTQVVPARWYPIES